MWLFLYPPSLWKKSQKWDFLIYRIRECNILPKEPELNHSDIRDIQNKFLQFQNNRILEFKKKSTITRKGMLSTIIILELKFTNLYPGSLFNVNPLWVEYPR